MIANHIKFLLKTLSIAGVLFLSFCNTAQNSEIISKKVPTILLNLLNAKDPVNFAKGHGIEVTDGMIRVVMTVNENFSSKLFVSKYNPKDFQRRKNLVTTYVTIDRLKDICEEPSILYIRLPFKFTPMGGTSVNKYRSYH